MANTLKKLASGTFATTVGDLYTASGSGFVKKIKICNKNTTTAKYFTMLFDGVEVYYQHSVAAKDTLEIPCNGDIIESTKKITGLAESTDITYYISGMEVS